MNGSENHLKREIIATEDGSATLFIPELNEHYHSIHGARKESMHVYIESGLKQLLNSPGVKPVQIRILEMGFGTGLNALLTLEATPDLLVSYTAIEKYPLSADETAALNYPEEAFPRMHKGPWEEFFPVTQKFRLKKLKLDLSDYETEERFNLMYFDAFAPDLQPDLWTAEIFSKLYTLMLPGGILTTYSAKGQVRRNMQAAGFAVERIPGPPGKREMLRARKALI